MRALHGGLHRAVDGHGALPGQEVGFDAVDVLAPVAVGECVHLTEEDDCDVDPTHGHARGRDHLQPALPQRETKLLVLGLCEQNQACDELNAQSAMLGTSWYNTLQAQGEVNTHG